MKKTLLTFVIALTSVCVFAQNNTNQNTNQQQQVQPKPTDTLALFQGRPGGPIKMEDVLKGDSLYLNKGGFVITGFCLEYVAAPDTAHKKLDSKNNKLTSEMKTALKGMKAGQNFKFSNIHFVGSDKVLRKPTYDTIDMFIEKTQ